MSMTPSRRQSARIARRCLAACLVAALACGAVAADDLRKVNGNITIGVGETRDKVSTVNGSVALGERAVATDVSATNGAVTLATGARADSVETVNGSVRLGQDVVVGGDVRTTNGAITALPGATINGGLGNVNGTITLDGARVAGLLSSSNGSVLIGGNSVVDGGLLMRKPSGRVSEDRAPRVVIGPGAQVNGTLTFERPVHLYVHDSARIGTVTGATPQRFSGSEPPSR